MNKRRLLKLADLLEADAENKKGIKFDLRIVAEHSKRVREPDWSNNGREFKPGDKPTLDCGTAACAVGLACLSGAFRRQGLTYDITENGFWPVFGEQQGFGEADLAFFELTPDEQQFLFDPWSYTGRVTGARGELRVAKRIRDFVAGKVAPETDA